MYHSKLWETSGHWQNYKDDMFTLDIEKEKWGLKPMNCPGHCLIFDSRDRSYKELPIRMAEFGIIHRNEASGALRASRVCGGSCRTIHTSSVCRARSRARLGSVPVHASDSLEVEASARVKMEVEKAMIWLM